MAAKPTSKASDVLVSFNHDICKILSVSATTLFELTQRLFAIGILNIHTKSVVMSRGGYKGADALLDYLEMRIDIKPEILHSVLEAMRELEVLKYVVKEMEKWEGEDVQISQDNILFTAYSLETNEKEVLKDFRNLKLEFEELLFFVLRLLDRVDLDFLKLRISWFFHNIESNTPEIQLILDSLTTPRDVITFLITRNFIGYLNYKLIKVFQKATESDEMKGKIENYEEMYKVILQRFSFNTITEVCRRHPELAPNSYIGMPKRIQQGLSQLLSVSKDEMDLHKMEQAFQKAVQKRGALEVNLAHYIPFGPPQVGKTCLLRRLVDKDPPGLPATIEKPCGNSHSTEVLEERKPIQVTVYETRSHEPKSVVAENSKWCEVESVEEEIAILVKTLATRPDPLHLHSQTNPSMLTNEPSISLEEEIEQFANKTMASEEDSVTNSSVSKLSKKAFKDRNMSEVHVQGRLDTSMTLYCTDTGGQPEFQEVLPALVAGPVIFLFVFSLLQNLDSTYNVIYNTPTQKIEAYRSSFTVKQMLMQFLSSVASYHSTISRGFTQKTGICPPSLIAIGTHWDLIKKDEELLKIIDKNLKHICDTETISSLTDCINIEYYDREKELFIIPIDNFSKDNDSISVRRVVEKVVKRDCRIEIPVPWLALQLHLRDLSGFTVTYTKCLEIAREYNIPDNDLSDCLRFLHHRTGTIRYYSDVDELKDTIIIKPSIIFLIVTQLITSTFTSENVRRGEIDRFQKLGLFKTSTVEDVFERHDLKLEISFKAFLALLEHLYILGPSHNESFGDYFFPCALVHAPESTETNTHKDPLLLIFGCGFIPKGFFSSLLAFLCQSGWAIAKKSNKPCLYRNEASFFVSIGIHNVDLKLVALNASCLEIHLQESESLPTDVFYKIREIFRAKIYNICEKLRYDKTVSKPHFGFYCSGNSNCSSDDQHCAVVIGDKLQCRSSGKFSNLDSRRRCWFKLDSDVATEKHYDSTESEQMDFDVPRSGKRRSAVDSESIDESVDESRTITTEKKPKIVEGDVSRNNIAEKIVKEVKSESIVIQERKLQEKDLGDVLLATNKASVDWFGFGLALGVQYADLKHIEENYRHNVKRCRIEMLKSWISLGLATWTKLVETLRSQNEISVAEDIEKNVF